MKEIPMLFSTAMVQAILAGRKTMTRRTVKFRNKKWRISYEANKGRRTDLDAFGVLDEVGNLVEIEEGTPGTVKELQICPYGKPGDILWVRETFRKYCHVDESGYTQYDNVIVEYAADNPPMINQRDADGFMMLNKDGTEKFISWKPSIHLPKEAARIWLEVTDIRVERLQEITEEDAVAEGVEPNCPGDTAKCPSSACANGCKSTGEYLHYQRDLDDFPAFSAKESFQSLWQSINDPESWNTNPWVWVVSFKVLSTTGKLELLTDKTTT